MFLIGDAQRFASLRIASNDVSEVRRAGYLLERLE